MKRIVTAVLAAFVLFAPTAMGQSKKETSLYNKTLKKLSIKSADKFLNKYPESVYAPEITRLKDSIIVSMNTSFIGKEEALQKAGACLDAVGWKKDGKEHILALDEGLALRILGADGTLQETRYIPHYNITDGLTKTTLIGPMEIVNLGHNHFHVHFSYLNEGYDNPEKEYVEALYSPDTDITNNAMFYGKALPAGDGEPFRIEGQSPEDIDGITLNAETLWLLERLNGNPSLVPLSKADILSDESIKWWREKNPKAETSASKLTFGTLDAESSLVEKYKKASKERGKTWNAAMFVCRGWTVIVAGNRSTGGYALVWAEPARGSAGLNSIYFENDGYTLDLVYYKAKRMSKVKISMANATVRRQK